MKLQPMPEFAGLSHSSPMSLLNLIDRCFIHFEIDSCPPSQKHILYLPVHAVPCLILTHPWRSGRHPCWHGLGSTSGTCPGGSRVECHGATWARPGDPPRGAVHGGSWRLERFWSNGASLSGSPVIPDLVRVRVHQCGPLERVVQERGVDGTFLGEEEVP